jgi:hypothetical protein
MPGWVGEMGASVRALRDGTHEEFPLMRTITVTILHRLPRETGGLTNSTVNSTP